MLSNDPTVTLSGDEMSGGDADSRHYGLGDRASEQEMAAEPSPSTFRKSHPHRISRRSRYSNRPGAGDDQRLRLDSSPGVTATLNVIIQDASDDGLFISGADNLVTGNQIEDSAASGVYECHPAEYGRRDRGRSRKHDLGQCRGQAGDDRRRINPATSFKAILSALTPRRGHPADGNAYSSIYVGSGQPVYRWPGGIGLSATIGGTTSAAANVISGNEYDDTGNGGIVVYGAGASDNLMEGKLIGVAHCLGDAPLANVGIGVHIFYGASDNTVGGTTGDAADVVLGQHGRSSRGWAPAPRVTWSKETYWHRLRRRHGLGNTNDGVGYDVLG